MDSPADAICAVLAAGSGAQPAALGEWAVLGYLDRLGLVTLGLGTVPIVFPKSRNRAGGLGGFPCGASSGAPRLRGSVCATRLSQGNCSLLTLLCAPWLQARALKSHHIIMLNVRPALWLLFNHSNIT